MGKLTTHVLDTSAGLPGSDMRIVLYRINGGSREKIREMQTNNDGRVDGPVVEGDQFNAGTYELVFSAGDYFRAHNVPLTDPAFLDEVVIRFGIASPDDHYHVPLLISPYGYSTYRGS